KSRHSSILQRIETWRYITAPPLTRITCPVINEAAGDANQQAAAATSGGVPQRPNGVSLTTRSCQVFDAESPHIVLIQPRAMQLTRTSGAIDFAKLLVNAITALLLTAKS